MTYREAGVDLDAADAHVAAIGPLVRKTWGSGVVGGFGGFAAGVTIPAQYQEPVLMLTTDGVGTKLDLARRADRWDGVGFDLVAMCVDDLAAVGAAPIGFVDYMAVGELRPERDRTIVDSIARACAEAGCALLGGETAEHPGVMDRDAVDLAGAAMGVVERGKAFDPATVEEGDVIIGLLSPNLRSNGFSLVRHVMDDGLDLDELLEPSVVYSPSVLAASRLIRSAAHITGGGLPGNLPRALPEGLGALIDTDTWEPPEIFAEIEGRGVPEEEMYRAFNMGIGFCVMTRPADAPELVDRLSAHDARVIGSVTAGHGARLK